MVASLRGSMGTWTKEDESSAGRIWTAGFNHVMAHSHFARILKLMSHLFLYFSNFFSGCSKPRVTETADMGVHLY